MEQSTLNRIKIEIQSFKDLIIANLIGGAFAIAFSMAYAVPKVVPSLVEGIIKIEQLPYIGLAIVGFSFGINWIIKSVELMSEHDEIVEKLENVGLNDEEAVIGIIVQSLAFYRENQAKITKLGIWGRVVGVFLLLTAILQLQALLSGSYSFEGVMVLGQWFGLMTSTGIGGAGLYLPTFIKRFTVKWNVRLRSAEEAEEKL